jgi:four helix bundle protein
MARIQGDLLERTFTFAVRVLAVADRLPRNVKGWEIGKQLIRSGTAVGANVREANNALTDAEFAHRCNVARKEAAETQYWLELCENARLLPKDGVAALSKEADEIVRVLSSVVKKTQRRLAAGKQPRIA